MAAYVHRTADFAGVAPELLRDAALLSGLLVAAASAAGLGAGASPVVRQRGSDGLTAVLLLDAEGCHVAAHAFPDRKLLMVDVLVPSARDTDKVIDVFARKLDAKDVRRGILHRG